MPTFEGARRKDDAKKALSRRPVLVLFYMIGCQHCEKNKPAWEEAKAKVPKGVDVMEVDSEATPDDEGVTGFPTMKYKPPVGREAKISGEKESGEEILTELGLTPKKGGSKRRRRTHRSRHRKLLRRTLRNYIAL
jgi:hypothetical protein